MERLTPDQIRAATDEVLIVEYGRMMRPDLSAEENAYFLEVIGERNERKRRAAWGEWVGQAARIARSVSARA